ncbi:hypothetical protein GCM10012275_16070 [Longimycelium tulufanense]|uniref:PLL-like beta propeller domain-containing protein n=1 Tax=Longimycelium tulufanense TaxID=907463 RepID=A0A8J3C720_9PSEU|nr:FG-GAP-like repeat-containing protein [Longimycelium tulufanense]GGM45846.1 hypothetical protein GCM10012275_16070 [Longimycelium tulufanense]
MKRRFQGRLLVAVVAAPATVAGSLLAATPASAKQEPAVSGCPAANSYAHHILAPGQVSGGGFASGARFGEAVAIGDFNKDGYADVAVGAPNDTVNGAASGAVYVYLGSANGLQPGVRLIQRDIGAGDEAGDRFGASLAAGDFNKDGYADLAVGIPGEAVGSEAKAGAIAVFPGSSSGLAKGKWFGQTVGGGSDEAGDRFGTALAAGDLNGDGYDDLAIGVPGEIPGDKKKRGGGVYIYKGSSSGVGKGWSAIQEDANGTTEDGDQFGAALAIGNVTGSRHADLVVGAPGEAVGSNPANGGAIYVVPGASGGKSKGFRRFQSDAKGANEANDRFGAAVAVGNFDKDGYADVAAGVPGEAPGSLPAGGSLLIFPGASKELAEGYWVQEHYTGETLEAGDRFGHALAASDVDKDGYADLLVGTPGKSYGTVKGAGAVYLFRGGPRETDSTRSLRHGRRIAQFDVGERNEGGDAFGSSLAMGDINGDGKMDAAVGSVGEATTGKPRSGTATALTKLARPIRSDVAVEQFSRTSAMQASPLPGAAAGTLEYAYTDNIGRLLHGHQPDPDNVNSVRWTVISENEAFTGQPALTEQADGKLQIFGHNATGPMWTRTQATKNPPEWASWSPVEGAMAAHATTARQEDGAVVAFASDADGVLWALPQGGANGSYTSWLSLGLAGFGGTLTAVPVSGGIQVFGLGSDGTLRTVRYADRTLSDCTVLSDPGLTGIPAVVVYPGSKIQVFVRGGDGSILTKKQDDTGSFPQTWDRVGTFTAAGSPSALISPASGKVEVVARGTDGGIYSTGETVQGSGEWRDWSKITFDFDKAATDPTAFAYANANGPTWAFVFRNSDNQSRLYNVTSSFGAAMTMTRGAAREGEAFTAVTLPTPAN